MKTKFILTSLLILPFCILAQDKLVDLGVGINPQKPGSVFTFDFSFNRTPSEDPKSGSYIWSKPNVFFKDTTDILAIKPSAEANFGNSQSSQNDFLFEMGFDYSKKIGKTTRLFGELAPAFNSNKNLDTSLYYGNIGFKVLFHNYPSNVPFYIVSGLNFHLGQRIEAPTKDAFYRLVPSIKLSLKLFNERLSLTSEGKVFILSRDELISNGSYGFVSMHANYMINKTIGISVKYVNGYDQPTFRKIEAITLGFSIYK